MKRTPRRTVLVITRSDDLSAEPVLAHIRERGGRGFRFDTDRFPTHDLITFRYHDGRDRLVIQGEGGSLDLGRVTAVWYRRVHVAALLPESMEADLKATSRREALVTLHGMVSCLDVFQLDPFPNVRLAENKPLQLKLAQRFGLEVPRTLITNDAGAVRSFARLCGGNLVTKPPAAVAIYDKQGVRSMYTSPVTAADLRDLKGLKYCPMIFQERVPKALELRAVVIGKRIFTGAIDSQASEHTRVDFRRGGLEMFQSWKAFELPRVVAAALFRIIDSFGLNYGAFDLILTPDGRYVFLELNPQRRVSLAGPVLEVADRASHCRRSARPAEEASSARLP